MKYRLLEKKPNGKWVVALRTETLEAISEVQEQIVLPTVIQIRKGFWRSIEHKEGKK